MKKRYLYKKYGYSPTERRQTKIDAMIVLWGYRWSARSIASATGLPLHKIQTLMFPLVAEAIGQT